MTPEKRKKLQALIDKSFLATEDIHDLWEGLRDALKELPEERNDERCSRCQNLDRLQSCFEWRLCPICVFDAKATVRPQVETGRVKSPDDDIKGFRWKQVMVLIERYGFVTAQSFREATGTNSYLTRDILSGYKKRGKLVLDKESHKYTIPTESRKPYERGTMVETPGIKKVSKHPVKPGVAKTG